MENTHPITKLISEWPSRKALADEIGAQEDAVHKWAKSGRVPPKYQRAVCDAALDRGLEYATADWMLSVHSLHFSGATQ